MVSFYVAYDNQKGGFNPICIGNTEQITLSESVRIIEEAEDLKLSEEAIKDRVIVKKIPYFSEYS